MISMWMVLRVGANDDTVECSRRWHEVLKPTINKERWSLYEVRANHLRQQLVVTDKSTQDEMLKHAVRAHGRRWIEIVERYFPDRTPIATKNR